MTPRQREIAEYIDAYWQENWTCPTVREIATKIGSSVSTAHHHLTHMSALRMLETKRLPGGRVLYRVPKTW